MASQNIHLIRTYGYNIIFLRALYSFTPATLASVSVCFKSLVEGIGRNPKPKSLNSKPKWKELLGSGSCLLEGFTI